MIKSADLQKKAIFFLKIGRLPPIPNSVGIGEKNRLV